MVAAGRFAVSALGILCTLSVVYHFWRMKTVTNSLCNVISLSLKMHIPSAEAWEDIWRSMRSEPHVVGLQVIFICFLCLICLFDFSP